MPLALYRRGRLELNALKKVMDAMPKVGSVDLDDLTLFRNYADVDKDGFIGFEDFCALGTQKLTPPEPEPEPEPEPTAEQTNGKEGGEGGEGGEGSAVPGEEGEKEAGAAEAKEAEGGAGAAASQPAMA